MGHDVDTPNQKIGIHARTIVDRIELSHKARARNLIQA